MEQGTLFEDRGAQQPLAARLRPRTLEEYVGQTHLLGEGKVLRRLIESDQISSMIFWGPPGVGKTTLARIIARTTRATFIDFSAVTSGIREIRAVMTRAEENQRGDDDQQTIHPLFASNFIQAFFAHQSCSPACQKTFIAGWKIFIQKRRNNERQDTISQKFKPFIALQSIA